MIVSDALRSKAIPPLLPHLPYRCGHVCQHGRGHGMTCGRLSKPVPIEEARSLCGDCGPDAKFIQFAGLES